MRSAPGFQVSTLPSRSRQIDGVVADALHDGAQLLVVEPQRLLRGALLGGVADEAHHRRTGCGLKGLEHDVDGEFGAVLAQAEEIEGRAHLAGAGMRAVVLAMARMAAAKTRRHQHLDRLPDQLLGWSSRTALQRAGWRLASHRLRL